MKRKGLDEYPYYIEWAGNNTANRVYPLSIAEGVQPGEIYVNEGPEVQSVLFWHYCGFGYISGEPTERFLEDIYRKMLSPDSFSRLALITADDNVVSYFRDKAVLINDRIEYSYSPGNDTDRVFEKDQFEIVRIDEKNIRKISGRIVPSFSWADSESFLKLGFGYAAMHQEEVCAAAFSSAISSDEVDIGVETAEACRGRGLASALAKQMCRHICSMGKKPVWAHAASNKGSGKTAMKCGFIQDRINKMITIDRGKI